MKLDTERLNHGQGKPKPIESALGFGKYFSDHMLMMDYEKNRGWYDARIVPYEPLPIDPAAMVLHYNQEIFEGMKAYRRADGKIYLFRPTDNISRMNASAKRMCMPEIDPDQFLKLLKEFVSIESEWVPSSAGTSLYLRPTMIANEAALGVRPATRYLFYIIASPVGAYFSQGFKPTRIFVSTDYVRAVNGGCGEAKTSGNYGPTLIVQAKAAEKGYSQVLWLDAIEHHYVEEVGTSNIFFLIDDELITPALDGTILPGITRDSVLQLAHNWQLKVSERRISILDVLDGCKTGRLKECFATGTAAVVSPIGTIGYNNEDYCVLNGQVGPLSKRFYNTLNDIQYGRTKDTFGWRLNIEAHL